MIPASDRTSVLRFRSIDSDVAQGQENFGQENRIAEEQRTQNVANLPVPVLAICSNRKRRKEIGTGRERVPADEIKTPRVVSGIGLSSRPGLSCNGITILKFADKNPSRRCRMGQPQIRDDPYSIAIIRSSPRSMEVVMSSFATIGTSKMRSGSIPSTPSWNRILTTYFPGNMSSIRNDPSRSIDAW